MWYTRSTRCDLKSTYSIYYVYNYPFKFNPLISKYKQLCVSYRIIFLDNYFILNHVNNSDSHSNYFDIKPLSLLFTYSFLIQSIRTVLNIWVKWFKRIYEDRYTIKVSSLWVMDNHTYPKITFLSIYHAYTMLRSN